MRPRRRPDCGRRARRCGRSPLFWGCAWTVRPMRIWPGECVVWRSRSGKRPHSCSPSSPVRPSTKSWPLSWPDASRPGRSGTLPQPTVSEHEWLKPAFSWTTSPPGQSGGSPPTVAGLPQMPPGPEPSDAAVEGDAIGGRRAVLEALRARRPLRKILIGRTTRGGTIREILQEARRQDVAVQFVDQRRLDALLRTPHQGVVALGSARPLVGVGKGLSRLVREHCDILVQLPMRGRIASLNVAVATGVLLYEVVRQMAAANP